MKDPMKGLMVLVALLAGFAIGYDRGSQSNRPLVVPTLPAEQQYDIGRAMTGDLMVDVRWERDQYKATFPMRARIVVKTFGEDPEAELLIDMGSRDNWTIYDNDRLIGAIVHAGEK